MRTGIVGLGYVGLTFGIAAAHCGIEVFGTEINENIKSCLKNNHAHFHENGLDELIREHNKKNFFCVEQFPADKKFDAFIITVGTPLYANSKTPNFEAIEKAINSIGAAYDGDSLIILRSTVSVGTTRKVVLPLLEKLTGRDSKNLFVGMCPERTVEGKTMYELTHLPQIISGNNRRALEIARKLFEKITPNILVAESTEEAELAKLYCNTYRDMNFAMGNAFCIAAQKFGVDGSNVIRLANRDYDRAKIALPGFVAGPCLEKDAYLLTNNMPDCESKNFILTARKISESLEDLTVDWVTSRIEKNNPEKILILSGMAFKGRPETSDLRGSSSVNIAKKLHLAGYNLRLHDFTAYEDEMKNLQVGEVFDDLEKACQGASALLVLTNHLRYTDFSFPENFSTAKKFPVLDVWNVCEKLRADNRIKLYTIGNCAISEEVKK